MIQTKAVRSMPASCFMNTTTLVLVVLACGATPWTAVAQDTSDTGPDLQVLQQQINTQSRLLDQQAAEIERQRRQLDEQRRQLQALIRQQTGVDAPADPSPSPASSSSPSSPPAETAARSEPPADAATRPEPEDQRGDQEITIIADVGGVLTRRGTLTVEPTLTASHTSSNRFFFQGVEIVDAVLIGAIEATESSRNYMSAQLGLRYGLTHRMEVSGKVPFVYRDDRVESTIISESAENQGEPTFLQNIDGKGLGDVEFGVQYQVNDGAGNWPYFVTNLRAKSTTGKGPFSVDRDADGIETELATGSGFWSVEPSVTMIYPTDPAVFFANFGYIWNIGRDVNLATGNSFIGRVSPGDTISGSFGLGFALNDRMSMSLGYQHNYVFGTTSEINGNNIRSNDFQVGSLLFGMSLGVGESTGLSMNVGIGVTDESPDVQFTLRMPFSLALFD